MSGEVEEYPTFIETFYPVVFYLDAANCKGRLLRRADRHPVEDLTEGKIRSENFDRNEMSVSELFIR